MHETFSPAIDAELISAQVTSIERLETPSISEEMREMYFRILSGETTQMTLQDSNEASGLEHVLRTFDVVLQILMWRRKIHEHDLIRIIGIRAWAECAEKIYHLAKWNLAEIREEEGGYVMSLTNNGHTVMRRGKPNQVAF